MYRLIFLYCILVNCVAFFLFGLGKWKAKNKRWRISESVLLLWVWLGGGLGALAGMFVFHHKIRKPKFMVRVPVIMLVQILVIFLLKGV